MLKNLYNLEHMLASIALKDTLYNSLVVLYHKTPSTAEKRAMIMRHIARISEDAKNLRKENVVKNVLEELNSAKHQPDDQRSQCDKYTNRNQSFRLVFFFWRFWERVT